MRILVFGAGAAGALAGGLLSSAHDVLLVGRRERIDPIRSGGLLIRDAGGEERRFHPEAADHPPPEATFDLTILSMKTFDLEDAVRALADGAFRPRRVLLLQNGMGNESLLGSAFPGDSIYRGLLYDGVSWEGPGRLRRHRGAPLQIGRPLLDLPGGGDAESEDLARAFSASGLRSEAAADIRGEIWRKLIVNSAINPVGAITGLPNGELIQRRAIRRLVHILTEEGEKAALAAEGRRFDLVGAVEESATRTAGNRNSLLLDLERGGRTEIDFLNGALLRAARTRKISLPANEAVHSLVKAMEGRGSPSGNRA